MRPRRSGAACAAIAALVAFALPGSAMPRLPKPLGSYVPNEVIVRYTEGVSATERDTLSRSIGARVIDRIDELDAELLHVGGDALSAASAFRSSGLVESAEPNMLGHTASAPPSRANDPLVVGSTDSFADRQWYLQRINALYGWGQWPRVYYSAASKIRSKATAVKVAVLDTWIDTGHADFINTDGVSSAISLGGQIDVADATSLLPAKDLQGKQDWHGTFVAGLIGAATDNSVAIAGVAYQAQIMPVVVAKGDGTTTAFRVAKGVTWAAAHGARVINISLAIPGSTSSAGTLRDALKAAVAKGAVVVASAGNGAGGDDLPAAFAAENPGVVAVGATNVLDRRAQCSKKSGVITVSAPGEMIWSLAPRTDQYGGGDETRRDTCGTSQAAAIASGVAALVAGRYPALRPAEIARRLAATADDVGAAGRDDETGAGRVNAERALWPGGGAGATWVSLPTAGTTVTVAAMAASAAGVSAAEVLLDGARRSRGLAMRPADGRWGTRERVVATIDTSKLTEGPHEIQVRARDAKGAWGPAAAGVLIVDHSPPHVGAVQCQPQSFVDPDDPRSVVLFTISDTWSTWMQADVDLIDAALDSQAHFHFARFPAATYQLVWQRDVESRHGGPLTPGEYRVIVNVTDEAGQSAYAEGACVVGATKRSAPSEAPTAIPGAPGGPGGVPTAVPTSRPTPTVAPSGAPTPDGVPTAVPIPTATPTL